MVGTTAMDTTTITGTDTIVVIIIIMATDTMEEVDIVLLMDNMDITEVPIITTSIEEDTKINDSAYLGALSFKITHTVQYF